MNPSTLHPRRLPALTHLVAGLAAALACSAAPAEPFPIFNSDFGVYTDGTVLYADDDPRFTVRPGDCASQTDWGPAEVRSDPTWPGPDRTGMAPGQTSSDMTLCYQMSFDLVGFHPPQAELAGRWSDLAPSARIFFNGRDANEWAAGSYDGSADNASHWAPFRITKGFTFRDNILAFQLNVGDVFPPYLQVVFDVHTAPLPEPAPAALVLAALVGWAARRRAAR